MLFLYFIRRFFLLFILIFVGLLPLFASCDIVVRLASIPFSFSLLKLFWFMFPLISLFALPVASCLSVGVTIGNMFARDESWFFHFFPAARRKIALAVLLFSVTLLCVYIPLLFVWAPGGYWRGKQFLVRAAQQQIENLPAKKFHYVASRCTIFFADKNRLSDGTTQFVDILLMVKEKQDKQYMISSRYGRLKHGELELFDGSIYNKTSKGYCVASFKILEIAFEKIFFQTEKGYTAKPAKFLSLKELIETRHHDLSAWREWHKRIVQIIWQFLFPFLLFWSMMVLARQKSNILQGIVLSGAFFLFSYLSVNMAYVFLVDSWWVLILFYMVPLMVAAVSYRAFLKKWM